MLISNKQLEWAFDTRRAYLERVKEQNLGNKDVFLSSKQIAEIRKAERIINSTIHPDTGRKVPALFRMCFFIPANLPIVVGMFIFQKYYWQVVLFQWFNQSYNAGQNYCNRQASAPISKRELFIAYFGAVGSSVSVGLFSRYLSNKYIRGSSILKQIITNSIVAGLAMAVAGGINIILIRRNEMKYGIDIKDKEGEVLGKSRIAAKRAVFTSSLTRILPNIWTIGVISSYFYVVNKFSKLGLPPIGTSPRYLMHKLFVVLMMMGVLAPLGLALFPKILTLPLLTLENQFHGKRTLEGELIHSIYFYRGI